MTPHDPDPVYDMNLVLQLLQSCFATEQFDFWGKILHEHQITTSLTHVDAFRDAFIQHMFSGTCVLHHGSGCKAVVAHERWPQSMGIRMIDCMLKWVERDALSLINCTRICDALGIQLAATQKKRSMRIKLSDRRRQLLRIIDSAEIPLDELIPHLGSTSLAKGLKSMGAAHGITTSDNDTKDSVTERIIDHVARGRCVDGVGNSPGCHGLVKHADLDHVDSVYLQLAVLAHVVDTASKKQLHTVLDAHDISYIQMDSHKKLQSRLRKYVQTIERGKLTEVKARFDEIERLRRLDDIRKQWPKLLPIPFKEKIVKDF